jgi:glucose/arabinose dehydrogenase
VLCGLGLSTLFAPACSDDDDDSVGNHGGSAGRAGSTAQAGSAVAGSITSGGNATSEGGAGGDPSSVLAGAGAGGGSAGTNASGGEGGANRNEFRPDELPFDEQAFEELTLPDGFSINVYRSGLGQARMLAVHGPHVYVTQPMQGNVLRLVDDDEDGVAESQQVVASGLPMVHGIAFHEDEVFLANVNSVFHASVETDGSFGTISEIIDDLPDGGQHALRTLGVGPDELLYISVGSDCDACPESNPEHATLLRSTLAGQAEGERSIFASGLRNTIGFAWHPGSGALWGVDNGSDWRGDNLPPEELNLIVAGKDYGWPYCYADRQADAVIQDPPDATKAEYCAETEPPVLLNQAHEAPIGLTFYTGDSFPERYANGAFVAFHGSWNRTPATGYRVAFIPFDHGEPQSIESFVDGFLIREGTATFGRPAGITVAEDGALLFTDDTNGIVYRVQYE